MSLKSIQLIQKIPEVASIEEYLQECAIFKVKQILKRGLLLEMDKIVLSTKKLKPVKNWFYCDAFLENIQKDDYVLAKITTIDPFLNNYVCEIKDYESLTHGIVLKKCNFCERGYLLKKNFNYYCVFCKNNNIFTHGTKNLSIHYGIDLT